MADEKWISVDERLPEKCVPVLVIINSGNGQAVEMDCLGEYDRASWVNFRDEFVTHWMPLPAPPEAK